ncbi:hypothetical protein FXF53_04495 [Micromonospora sp. WP24]|uniref:hypothetical protein n=1 Tax=Micromonospora sp. WP24 TaxID=2604469 RepID=UPI0011D8500A|nr:hypothetical protein [Micromonospora sp. WP24]TYC05679.1 hypothetical protein FXF53_04495 [Micromonospora sp. WP24]
MVNPTWEERDLPVLRAAVELYEETGRAMRVSDIVARSEFDEGVVQAALRAVAPAEPPFFTSIKGSFGGGFFLVGAPTPEARRAVGLWPTPENLADRLVQAMAQAADREPDPEKRGWLRKTADWLGSAGRDIAVDVAGTALAKGIGAS